MKHPDPRRHLQLSLIKSAIRIAAGVCLAFLPSAVPAGVLLIAAEIVGIVEEMV